MTAPLFGSMLAGAGALAIIAGPFFVTRARQLINLAALHRVPTIYFRREFAVAGGLMSYGSDISAIGRWGCTRARFTLELIPPTCR